MYGTPYTKGLHVVERYRLIDYEVAKEAVERAGKENVRIAGWAPEPNYRGKGLQLQFTVEDEGVFTMPWSATVTYLRAAVEWPEVVCALRYEHSSDRVRSVSLLPERKRQFAKPPLHPIRFDVREVLTIHTRCALVGAALGIRTGQDVFTADLVIQGVETIPGFCLRFRVQRRLQFLNTLRSC
jgi:hypothetical protein